MGDNGQKPVKTIRISGVCPVTKIGSCFPNLLRCFHGFYTFPGAFDNIFLTRRPWAKIQVSNNSIIRQRSGKHDPL